MNRPHNVAVSVVIPTYNRGEAVRETVESVLRQDLPADECEILIVDDGSTDGTWEFLQKSYGSLAQVRLLRQANGGVASARNLGLQQARGEFIAFLDHDDLWLPAKLRLQLDVLRRCPEVGVVYCDWIGIDESGAEAPPLLQISRQRWWRAAQGEIYPWIWMPHPMQFLRNPLISMSLGLLRAALLREAGGFDARLVPSDDWDLWIRLAQRTRFAWVPQALVRYRFHAAQQHLEMDAAYRSWLALCRKHPASARRHPLLWLKQKWFGRYCRAFLLLPRARAAAARRDWSRLARVATAALCLRPDILATNRWRRVLQDAASNALRSARSPRAGASRK